MKPHTLHIAFFVGSDITSHLIVNKAIRALIEEGHKPYIFFVLQKQPSFASQKLRELFFYERQFLNAYVYPFLDTNNLLSSSNQLLTLQQFKEVYGDTIHVEEVEDIHDPDLFAFFQKNHITAGVSIRCYQKFSTNLIDYFNNNSNISHQPFFVNLHPGLLPAYRGVTTYCRAMQNQDRDAGFSLHFINSKWDAGAIISKEPQPLDYSLSVVENMCMHVDSAVSLLLSGVGRVSHGEYIESKEQSKAEARYYSHPTDTDLADFEKKGVILIRPKEIMDLILKKYLSLSPQEIMQLTHSTTFV